MTIDEIRTKYQCDKRQTGQVALNPLEKGGIDFRKAGANNSVLPGLKRAVRAKVQGMPGAETTAYNAKMKRQSKAWFLGELRNLENAIKKSDDKTAIRTAFEKMSVKFKELLNQL